MSLLQMLMNAQGGQGLGQLAQQFGPNEEQASGLAGMLDVDGDGSVMDDFSTVS
jgi:hypothetical protein